VAERRIRHSPLAHLHLAARVVVDPGDAGARMSERPPRAQLAVRGDSGDKAFVAAFKAGLGFSPPLAANTVVTHDGLAVFWLGPSEWLLVGEVPGEQLAAALADRHHALVDVSDSRIAIGLSGPRARDVLAKLCPLDLAAPALAPGRCAGTILARGHMLLHVLAEDSYDIHVHRSFADYAWRMLEDAALEYGVAVIDGGG